MHRYKKKKTLSSLKGFLKYKYLNSAVVLYCIVLSFSASAAAKSL
jgi:hypothetical protein